MMRTLSPRPCALTSAVTLAPSTTAAGVGTTAGNGALANDSAVSGEKTVAGGGIAASGSTEASARLLDAESVAESVPLRPRRWSMPGEAVDEHWHGGFVGVVVFYRGGNGQ